MRKANFVFSILGLVLCAYIWISSAAFPRDAIMVIGPEFFPRVMATGMGIASVALLIHTLWIGHAGEAKPINFKDPGIRRAIIVFVAAVLYAMLLEPLGFVITTILFMIFMMYMLRFRSYGLMFLASIATVCIVIFAFQIMLQIQLPPGILDGMLPWM